MRAAFTIAAGLILATLVAGCSDFESSGEAMARVSRVHGSPCEIVITQHLDRVKTYRARLITPECKE